jgi:hypothetical protein
MECFGIVAAGVELLALAGYCGGKANSSGWLVAAGGEAPPMAGAPTAGIELLALAGYCREKANSSLLEWAAAITNKKN